MRVIVEECVLISSCLRQVPPPCQPRPLGSGCSNDGDYDGSDDDVVGDDDDDDDENDDDDYEEEWAEMALGAGAGTGCSGRTLS